MKKLFVVKLAKRILQIFGTYSSVSGKDRPIGKKFVSQEFWWRPLFTSRVLW